MLPRLVKLGIPLGILLICCIASTIVAGDQVSTNLWQNEPINCLTCDNVADCANGNGLLRKCQGKIAQTCVVVFDDTGAVTKRGCSDDVAGSYGSYCGANKNKCFSCSSNGCNDATAIDEYNECISCDSAIDKNCVLDPSQITTKKMCAGQCMTALYAVDQQQSSSAKYQLVRSCLNDVDLDDRIECVKGTTDKCVACDGANCNVDALKAERLQCAHCAGVDCEDNETYECIAYQEGDECYVITDEFSSVTDMGCLSDLGNASEIEDLIKQKSLYKCDYNNCNYYGNLPNRQSCTSCSSADNQDCAVAPPAVTKTELCNRTPYSHCYERVVNGTGATERGCLYDLETEDFYACLIGEDANCRVCLGNTCNKEIIPEERPQCERCDSVNDQNCQSSPKSLRYCPTYNPEERCVSLYEDGVVKRGCASELSCDAQSKNCDVCKGDGCNTIDIKKRAEEIYGAFQDLPLNCYTCTNAEECQKTGGLLRKCIGNPMQDCMTVFDNSSKLVRRGCEEAVEAEYADHCNAHPEQCFKCKSNGCNTLTSPSNYQECIYCDAASNPDCLFNPERVTTRRKCVEGCISSFYPRKSNPQVFDFLRSCYEDIEIDDRTKCTPENNCVRCTNGNACNTVLLPAEGRLSCLHCNGNDCNVPVSKKCVAYSAQDQCYMFFDNVTLSAVRAGCLSELQPKEVYADIKQYYICDGDNCNDYVNLPDAKICFACDSATDINCAVDPAAVKDVRRCQINPYTECYTRVRVDGHTERGCLQSLATSDFIDCYSGDPNSNCKICKESRCNGNVFPSSRQRCYRCNSLTDSNCESEPTTTQACPLYLQQDTCVTKLVNGITMRGCGSELDCSDSDRKSCRSCTGSNCNNDNLVAEDIGPPGIFQGLPLNCYHCADDVDCWLSMGKLQKCNGNPLQTCTVAFGSNGKVVARGCSDLLESACSEIGNSCYDCKSNGCNTAQSIDDYEDCLFCDAAQNEDCVYNVAAITRTRKCNGGCIAALYSRSQDAVPAYEVLRTCLDDLDLDDRDKCVSGEWSACKACNGTKCNTADVGERLSCYQCEGDDCQDPQKKECRAVMAQDQCFIEFDESSSITRFGCKSQYDADELKLRISQKRMWLCEGPNCNHIERLPSTQSCAICSSRTNPNCAINTTAVASTTSCANLPVTQCYMRVLPSGHTERGCASSLGGDDFYDCYVGANDNCAMCTGYKCNAVLFPEPRLSCHVCSSTTSEDCDTVPNSPELCLLYTPTEQCVTSIDASGMTWRGCSSSVKCDASDKANCRLCDGDNCNNQNLKRKADGKPGLWQALPLSCNACEGEAECSDAAAVAQETCTNDEYCMTVINANGQVAMRGCSNAVEMKFEDYCDTNSGNCFNCNSNYCNDATSLTDYIDCIYCDSLTNPNCRNSPSAVTQHRRCNTQCMTALWPRPNSTALEVVRSCLDDKDIADQLACTGGSCKACDTNGCNTDILTETRLSCYKCENCMTFEPGACEGYRENDKCFILFDEMNEIVRMGCLSDLDDDYINANISMMYTCDEKDLCNDQANIPQPQICVQCNSIDDPDCAAAPTEVPSLESCASLPNTQCYTRVLTDGSTMRGCVSDLNANDMTACLTGSTSTCSVCRGDRCNVEIFPADRRMCQRCNSKEDPSCANSPDASSACPRYVANDGCSVKLVNGYTYRGCRSEFSCDDTDKQYCRNCATDNCNVADLENNVIGYPGKWQKTPLSCYNCTDADCNNGALGELTQCGDNDYQNCVTVFADTDVVVQRGCSDAIYAGPYGQWCDEQNGKCQFCKSSGCNVGRSLNDYIECIACDGVNDVDCVFEPSNTKGKRSCYKQCLSALYPRRAEVNPAHEMDRSCADDLPAEAQLKCGTADMPNCKICEGANCNTALIPETRLTCYFCANEDCTKSSVQTCSAYREHEQCYTFFGENNEILKKGCLSDLDTSFIQPHLRYLFKCDEANCNTEVNYPVTKSCKFCNSTNELECITGSEVSTATVCENLPYTDCYTKVFYDGRTERGCLYDLPEEDFAECLNDENESCKICSENNCNTEFFPADRRSCLRCDSSVDERCADEPAEYSSLCPLYAKNDQCVVTVVGDRILRGCGTELACDPNNANSCVYCDKDNCNNKKLRVDSVGDPGKWQALPLSCHKCKGAECTNGVTPPISQCEGNNKQNCMVVFDESGVVLQRDCSDAVEESYGDYCVINPEHCVACKSNACNNYDFATYNNFIDCYFCDSLDGSNCALNVDEIKRTRKCKTCMAALYPRSSANDSVYEISRSCLDDMDQADQAICLEGSNELCKACNTPLCNNMSLPEDRLECYQCIGDCEFPEVAPCAAYKPNDKCYMLFDDTDNSIIVQGCSSEFQAEQVVALIMQKQLIQCDGNACNGPEAVPTPKQCKICNSDEDARCATNPNLVPTTVRCSGIPYPDCYTRVNEQGVTERGCISSLPNEEFYECITGNDTLCYACPNNNCNGLDVFPADRLKCHQCDSLSDPKCVAAPNSNIVCPLYDANDACVTTLRNGVTMRGCASTLKCDDPTNSRTCRTCNTPGCNTDDLSIAPETSNGQPGRWQDVPISCHTCLGAEQCGSSMGGFRMCQNDPYQNCVTVFDDKDVVLQRGCRDSIESDYVAWCKAHPELCPACNSNGCNIAVSLNEYIDCWVCDALTNPDCNSNLQALTQTRKCRAMCMTALYKRDEEQNPAYVLARDCYDELDMDDRDACAAGDLANCKACSTGKCNTAAVPEERLSCYQCKGDECQLAAANKCPFYRENDKCYILFDERKEIVSQGCRSEFTNAEADYLLSKKYLTLCEGNNCNTIDSLPTTQTCVICNSRTDIACAIAPKTVTSTTQCGVMPYTHCYTRTLDDGATERGCISSLNDNDFVSCLDSNSTNCTPCLGAKCNNKVFPETRLSCHTCDSRSDPTCQSMPNSLSICAKYDPNDMCITSYENEVTIRGCASAVTCDASYPSSCAKCQSNGCNTVDLSNVVDDNLGKWQDLPLKCWTCEGAQCDSMATTQSLTCENNNLQECVTVFDGEGKVVRRGCSDDVAATHGSWCSANKNDCLKCKSNDCNSATAKSEFMRCLYCDSSKDGSCLPSTLTGNIATRWCQGGCMTALYLADGSANPAYELIRTCLNDKEAADQVICAEGKDPQCSACMTEKCNTDAVPENRLSCYSCEGRNCETPQPQLCPLYKENDQCFIWFDQSNSISQMGCLSAFRNQDVESIIKTKRVVICDGMNCNVPEVPMPQRCAACNSNEDLMCALNAKEVITFDTCDQLPYTHCYSLVTGDGSTARGCLSDLPQNDFAACLLGDGKDCDLCLGDGCNRELFPADRLQCYSCTSEDDENCESNPSHMTACPFVRDSETCITALTGNITARGCSTLNYCDITQSDSCRSCGRTQCNAIDLRNKEYDPYQGYWQELPLKCHKCEGENCKYSLGPAFKCEGNPNQECMTVFDASGEVISRGCENAVEDYYYQWCRLHPDHCFRCKSNECNDVWTLEDYVECVYCNSETDPNCAIALSNSNLHTRACNRECLVAMRNGEIIRSCLDDKELQERNACRGMINGTSCASCDQKNCNNFVFPSDRLSCHVCKGTGCSNSEGEYCRLYDKDDFCFAKYEQGKVDLLGCASAQNENDIKQWRAEKKLFECKDNNCNDLQKLPPATVCLSCDSSKSPNCAQNPLLIMTYENCAAMTNECVTWVESDGRTLRACLSSVEESVQASCTAAGTCTVCSGTKCNIEIYPADRRKCHICDSVSDSKCIDKPDSLEICPNYAADDKCVSKKLDNKSVQRGCASSYIDCSNDSCETCNTDGCNTIDLSGAFALSASFAFTMLLAIVAMLANVV